MDGAGQEAAPGRRPFLFPLAGRPTTDQNYTPTESFGEEMKPAERKVASEAGSVAGEKRPPARGKNHGLPRQEPRQTKAVYIRSNVCVGARRTR
jgi:hypothetical protein